MFNNLTTFSKLYLGTFENRRDVNVKIDVTMATVFWQQGHLRSLFPLSRKAKNLRLDRVKTIIWNNRFKPCAFIYPKQNEPSLTANFTTLNITAMKKYLVGDRLFVDWLVSHTYNTSYEGAKNVRITFYSNTLKILQGTYITPPNSGNNLTVNNEFRSDEINVAALAKGRWKISEIAK